MNVFLSWSGDVSKQVAIRLREWLPLVLVDVVPWISEHDIQAGSRWESDLGTELSQSKFGIFCLTPENLHSPWLLFEAGAISKDLGNTRLVPYRFGITAAAVGPPLSQFQGVDANEAGTRKLVQSLNASRDHPVDTSRVKRVFDKWWPELAEHLANIASAEATVAVRTDREVLEEMLEDLRRSVRVSQESGKRSSEGVTAMVLLQGGCSMADLAARKQLGEVVVEWSKLARNPEEILPNLELEDATRLAGLGFSMPDQLRDLLVSLSCDLGSTDPRDLQYIQGSVADAGVLASSYLIKAAALPDPVKRGHAAYLLGFTGDPDVVPVLATLLSDSEGVGLVNWLPTVGAAAKLALQRIGTPEALAALEGAPE